MSGTRGVAQVRAVFLEGQAEHGDARPVDAGAGLDHLLDGLLGKVFTHAVIDAPASEDDVWVMALLLGLVREVVGVDADAVTADQPGAERQEVPLGAGRLQHLAGVDAEAVKQHGQLVHQGDVEVALGVLDDLGCLRDADARCAVHACLNHRLVQGGDTLQGRGVLCGYHLDDGLQAVFAVGGVDALGRVADVEAIAPG